MRGMFYTEMPIRKSICALLLCVLVDGCSDTLDERRVDVDRLCSLSSTAFQKREFDALFSELEKQLGTVKSKMRVTDQGIFVPTKQLFVEESGYFISRPGVELRGKSADPAFELVKGCMYRYRIKG